MQNPFVFTRQYILQLSLQQNSSYGFNSPYNLSTNFLIYFGGWNVTCWFPAQNWSFLKTQRKTQVIWTEAFNHWWNYAYFLVWFLLGPIWKLGLMYLIAICNWCRLQNWYPLCSFLCIIQIYCQIHLPKERIILQYYRSPDPKDYKKAAASPSLLGGAAVNYRSEPACISELQHQLIQLQCRSRLFEINRSL